MKKKYKGIVVMQGYGSNPPLVEEIPEPILYGDMKKVIRDPSTHPAIKERLKKSYDQITDCLKYEAKQKRIAARKRFIKNIKRLFGIIPEEEREFFPKNPKT